MKNALVWFRKDLRLHDNIPIKNAAKADTMLPLYVLPQREIENVSVSSDVQFPKMNGHRRAYLESALIDLKQSLQAKNSDLMFANGDISATIRQLCEVHSITDVYTSELPGTDETHDLDLVQDFCDEASIKLHVYDHHTLYHLDDLPFAIDELPTVFTPFRKKTERYAHVREAYAEPLTLPVLPSAINGNPLPAPAIPGAITSSDSRLALPSNGGEKAALRHLESYIWEKQLIKTYKETRNGLVGLDFSSKLSGWLAVGAISPRFIYAEVKRFESEVVANDSTYWLIFELLWRDFFQFLMMRFEGKLFQTYGILPVTNPAEVGTFTFDTDSEVFESWCAGRTDSDFVNANMIELSTTGFMSNRGRQNVASYLAKTLNIDWRWGARWFESQLMDYDVASNWGNWAYVSGVGTDPRNRVFNVDRQAEMYDKDKSYRKLWL